MTSTIELVRDDGDDVVGVETDRSERHPPRAEGREASVRVRLEPEMVPDDEKHRRRQGLAADVGGALVEDDRDRIGRIGKDGLEPAARDGEAGRDRDEAGCFVVGTRGEDLLHRHRHAPLVRPEETNRRAVDAEDPRRARASEEHEVHRHVFPDAMGGQHPRADAAEEDVEPAARPGQVVEQEVVRRARPLTEDDEASNHGRSIEPLGARPRPFARSTPSAGETSPHSVAGMRILFFLAIGALAWIPSLRILYQRDPDGRTAVASELIARQIASTKASEDMRRVNPEWDFMRRTYAVLALANQALAAPAERQRNLDAIDVLVDQTLAEAAVGGDEHFMLPYARGGSFVDPAARSLFIDGEILAMLAARDVVSTREATQPEVARRAAAVVSSMRRSPSLSGESYPNECWTFCNTTALAGLAMLPVSPDPTLVQDWVTHARKHLVDARTGLLVSSYTRGGRVLDGPEGSSLWMTTSNLMLLDEPFGRDQYVRARAALRGSFAGFGWAREWPASGRHVPDVDSGPIVPFLEASAGSSGLALLGAKAAGDEVWLAELFASVELAGFRAGGHYRAGNDVGDAAIAYALSFGPLWARVRASRQAVP